jgi:hypothetical protein
MYRLPSSASAPEFHELLGYWLSKRPPGVGADWLPGRQHIDPAEIPARQLSQVLLFDVVPGEPRRFRFRVAGTAFAALAGRDVTGLHYDEIAPPDRIAMVTAGLNLAVDRAAPVFLEGRLTLPSQEYFWVRRIGLPLAQDGRHVDMVLGLWLAERRSFTDLSRADLSCGRLEELEGPGPQVLERI